MSLSAIESTPDAVRVWKLFKYSQEAFGRVGIAIGFPKHTPPEKTYKWRYLVAFLQRVDRDWKVTDQIAYKIIDQLVSVAVERKLLHKGLALLLADKLLMEACERAKIKQDAEGSMLRQLRDEHQLVAENDLMGRDQARSLPNLVKWFMQGKLSCVYVAASKRCHEGMMKLEPIERSLLPSGKELISARLSINGNMPLKRELKKLLGSDFKNGL